MLQPKDTATIIVLRNFNLRMYLPGPGYAPEFHCDIIRPYLKAIKSALLNNNTH